MALRLVTVPLLINHLGHDRFGVWVAISSIAGYILLLDLGLSSAMINKLSRLYAAGDVVGASRHFQSIFVFLSAIALAGLGGALVLQQALDWPSLLQVHLADGGREIRLSVFVAVAIFFLQLPGSVLQKLPYTWQAGYVAELHLLGATLLGAAGIIGGVAVGAGLPFLIIAINASVVVAPLTLAIHLAVTGRLRPDRLSWRIVHEELSSVKSVGLEFMVIQACGSLLVVLPFSLITYWHGAAAVVGFSLLLQVIIALQTPLTVMLQPMWTKMVQLRVAGEFRQVKAMFSLYLASGAAYSVVAVAIIMIVLQPLLDSVLTHRIELGLGLRTGFAVWCVFGLIGGGGVGALVMALGLTRQIARIITLRLIMFLLLAVWLVPRWGPEGAVTAVVGSDVLALSFTFRLIRTHLYCQPSAA